MKCANLRVAELWGRYKGFDDREAKKALVLEYAHLVKQALARMSRSLSPRAELADLTSSGIVGLMDALSKFEIERDIKFETYAAIRIHGAIVDHLRSLDWVPRGLRRQARALEESLQAQEHRLGRTPSLPEIAQHMQITVEQLEKLLRRLADSTVVSLEDCVVNSKEQEIPLRDVLPDNAEGPEQRAVLSDLKARLSEGIASLPEKARRAIALYYFQDYNLREIGTLMGLSEASICQIHGQALRHLRAAFHGRAEERPAVRAPRKPTPTRSSLEQVRVDSEKAPLLVTP